MRLLLAFKRQSKFKQQALVHAVLLIAMVAMISGCGRQAFNVGTIKDAQKGPGTYEIPAKVDIVFAEDDTGSMYEAFEQISDQIPGLLDSLEAHGWDYHFATTPLTTQRPLAQMLTSKFTGNWGMNGLTSFLPPYPGATPSSPGLTVNPSFFRTPSQYTDFIDVSGISNQLNQYEPGFATIRSFIEGGTMVPSGFLRPDALLVTIVVSNGNDSSGVAFCTRSDGWVGPCEEAGFPQLGTKESSFQGYKAFFTGLPAQGKTRGFKMFAAVANAKLNQCLGGSSFIGERYRRMAMETGGGSYDLCSSPIASTIEGMANFLHNERKNYRQAFLALQSQPKLGTIRVIKHPDGDLNQSIELPEDPINGWTYAGVQTVYLIDDPIPLNQFTGHVIELHGSARLLGSDQADVLYDPAQGQPSS